MRNLLDYTVGMLIVLAHLLHIALRGDKLPEAA